MSKQQEVYIIGYNAEGQCGFNTCQTIKELTKYPNKEITRVFPGRSRTLFANNDLSKVWSAGWNWQGGCGVNSERHAIPDIYNIHQIF